MRVSLHFAVFLQIIKLFVAVCFALRRVDLEVLLSLGSILGINKIPVLFVHAVSASDGPDNYNNDRESDWHDKHERIFLFLELNNLWVRLNNHSLGLDGGFSLNTDCDVVVRHRLFNLNIKVRVEVVSSTDVCLGVFSIHNGYWLVCAPAAGSVSFCNNRRKL